MNRKKERYVGYYNVKTKREFLAICKEWGITRWASGGAVTDDDSCMKTILDGSYIMLKRVYPYKDNVLYHTEYRDYMNRDLDFECVAEDYERKRKLKVIMEIIK
jgi:hypothetical protein